MLILTKTPPESQVKPRFLRAKILTDSRPALALQELETCLRTKPNNEEIKSSIREAKKKIQEEREARQRMLEARMTGGGMQHMMGNFMTGGRMTKTPEQIYMDDLERAKKESLRDEELRQQKAEEEEKKQKDLDDEQKKMKEFFEQQEAEKKAEEERQRLLLSSDADEMQGEYVIEGMCWLR